MSGAPLFPVRIDGGKTTLVLGGAGERLPFIAYFGPSLPHSEDLNQLVAAGTFPIAHASLDAPFQPSLFPEEGEGGGGMSALRAFALEKGQGRRWATRFWPSGRDETASTLTLHAKDEEAALFLTLSLALNPETGVLRASSRLTNRGETPLVVEWLAAPVLPVLIDDTRLLSWHGRWCGELQRSTEAWPRGARLFESRTGRTSHEVFPGLVSLGPGADDAHGRALIVHFAWSGNWRMIAEEHAPGWRQIMAGLLPLPGETVLAPGESLATPELFAAVSAEGLNAASQALHREARTSILVSSGKPRPVHFNSWEALYFNLDTEALIALADHAAALGAERFVVDDGWFPARHADNAGLGDWEVDPQKFPDGFHPLVRHLEKRGLEFGLWVEPEMVNEDSALYRAHPEWVLHHGDEKPPTARQQWVLDIARPEVSAYLFAKLDALLCAYPIAYLKWDMNRVLHLPGREGRAVASVQPEALYALLARLREKHPQTEIESCASGGGRMDFGVLRHTTRFWLSDNNDAHDRWSMRQEASVFFPSEILGFHVGPAPSHTSGRRLSMAFRAFSAAVAGHMGMELDLRTLDEEERAILASAIGFYKTWRSLLHTGRFHRLNVPAPYLGQMTLAEEGTHFLAVFVQREQLPHLAAPMVRLVGLDPARSYRVRLARESPFRIPHDRGFYSPLGTEEGLTASGAALMGQGFRLPTGWPDELWLIEGERI